MSSNSPTLRLMVISDFGLEKGRTYPFASRDIGTLLETLAPTSTIRVRNRMTGRRKDEIECTLEWRSLAAFTPAGIAAGLPGLEDLAKARRQLAEAAVDTSLHDLQELFRALPVSVRDSDLGARLRRPTAKADGGRVDALLARLDVPGDEPEAVLADLLNEIDRRWTRQLATVLEAPQVRAVETAWRGLAFLLAQDATATLSIELLSADKDDFLESFFDQVFHREYEGESNSPLAAVVLGYDFDRSLPDMERLQHAARMGESLRVPFLASMGHGYWGLKRAALMPNLPDLETKSSGPEYAKWNRLRADDLSLWLVLTMNRFLLRGAWGTDQQVDGEGVAWVSEVADVEPLWGEGAWALAAVLARAFAQGGASLPMTNVDLMALPCRPYGGRRSEPFEYPLEARLPQRRILEMAACGFAPLAAEKGEDSARFSYLPTFHRARRYTTDQATRASYQAATLPYQLFATLASRQLEAAGQAISPGLSEDNVVQCFHDRFSAFLGTPERPAVSDPEGAEESAEEPIRIEVSDDPENALVRQVTVRLRPTFEVCGGQVDLVLGLPVPR